ncbi:MAG: nuclear transport factor 2 family protein [Candidatus Eremiobacteraeota bacterium]|nr:nuclear transport factor 2 family protein [Candidatus Eremiobacteraeota bacterium]
MIIRIIISVLFLGLLPALPAAATDPGLLGDTSAVQAQLVASAAAFEHHDLRALAKTFINDDSLMIFEGGEVNRGWIDYRDNHIKPELAEIKVVHYTLTEIHPHIDGNTAWATFHYHIAGSTAKRTFDSYGIGTAIFRKVKGTWRIVHWHSTKSPKQPTTHVGAELYQNEAQVRMKSWTL